MPSPCIVAFSFSFSFPSSISVPPSGSVFLSFIPVPSTISISIQSRKRSTGLMISHVSRISEPIIRVALFFEIFGSLSHSLHHFLLTLSTNSIRSMIIPCVVVTFPISQPPFWSFFKFCMIVERSCRNVIEAKSGRFYRPIPSVGCFTVLGIVKSDQGRKCSVGDFKRTSPQ